MKPDISNKEDIKTVINLFYDKVKKDPLLGVFFTEVVKLDWERHLGKMQSFWENILFYTGEYDGDPLAVHRNIHQQHTTTPEHFKRWIKIFDETINQHFEGSNADKMKKHAKGIASVMMDRIS